MNFPVRFSNQARMPSRKSSVEWVSINCSISACMMLSSMAWEMAFTLRFTSWKSPTGTRDRSTSVSTKSSATPAARTEERRVAALFYSLIEAECDIEGSMATLVEAPIHELHPMVLCLRGQDQVRRYYDELESIDP